MKLKLKCRFGRHIGQADGGTLMFTCPRCGGSFWQPLDLSHVTARADAMIAAGRNAEALDYARGEIARAYGEGPASRAYDERNDAAAGAARGQERNTDA